MDRYLINYLKNNSNNTLQAKYIDYFKIELDSFIYNYGDHISCSHRKDKKMSWRTIVGNHLRNFSAIYGTIKQYPDLKNVLSSVYFLDKTILSYIGINSISSILQPVGIKQILGDKETVEFIIYKNRCIAKGMFNDIYNKKFFEGLEELKNKIIKKFEQYNFHALFLNTDQYFESKFLIEIFKNLDRPSMVFSHGLPGIYSLEVDNRSNYLMVWGDRIKQNYINAGFNPNKLIVIGNPKYYDYKKIDILRNTLDNVLVIPPSSCLWLQHTYDEPQLIDRSMGILYLYIIQHVLEKFGVKHTRFRPHPSIDKEWMYGFLDQNFYEVDKDNLKESCLKSTLIIGATSTVFLEALMFGVNYIIFEPKSSDNKNILRCNLVPPFDGSEKNLEIATSEEELEYLIKNKYQIDINILDEYMQPFDTNILKEIIK